MGRTTSLTPKGQVTIPKELRDHLGVKPFDRIEFYLENGEVKVRKAYPSLEEVAESLPPLGMPIEEAITQAKEERARRLVDKLR
jgi:AbrB family looped-hinge helix DNA binding protein